MARSARKFSEFGYAHLIVRGNGGQALFINKEDYLQYLSLLQRFLTETDIILCAYCLMNNHVHLLVYDENQNASLFMQKMGVAYSDYFNKKYDRQGHVFQGRYKSEPIESEDYLLTVFRYILNNPAKAGISAPEKFIWSSYQLYGNENSFVDTSGIAELIGDWDTYQAYIAAKNEDVCMEFDQEKHDDEWALRVIQNELGLENGMLLQKLPWKERTEALKLLKEKGLKIKQIERLTGINRGVIQKA